MKHFILTALILSSSSAWSSQPGSCKNRKFTRLEMIQLLASSEALAITAGPHADVSAIEIFAISNDGHIARANVTFTGSAGNSEAVTLRASVNCEAGGTVELE